MKRLPETVTIPTEWLQNKNLSLIAIVLAACIRERIMIVERAAQQQGVIPLNLTIHVIKEDFVGNSTLLVSEVGTALHDLVKTNFNPVGSPYMRHEWECHTPPLNGYSLTLTRYSED